MTNLMSDLDDTLMRETLTKSEDKLLRCHAMLYTQTYASSSDVLLQRRQVQQTVEVAVIKDVELNC